MSIDLTLTPISWITLRGNEQIFCNIIDNKYVHDICLQMNSSKIKQKKNMQNIEMYENFIGSPLDRPLSPTDLVVSLMIAGPSLFIYKTLFPYFLRPHILNSYRTAILCHIIRNNTV